MFNLMEQIKLVKSELKQLSSLKSPKDLEMVLERLCTNPQILNSVSIVINTQSQIKSLVNFSFEKLWKNIQLPNKKDQERTLYLLHELQFKIHQLDKELHRLKKSAKPDFDSTSLTSRPITIIDKRSADKPISKLV